MVDTTGQLAFLLLFNSNNWHCWRYSDTKQHIIILLSLIFLILLIKVLASWAHVRNGYSEDVTIVITWDQNEYQIINKIKTIIPCIQLLSHHFLVPWNYADFGRCKITKLCVLNVLSNNAIFERPNTCK